MLRRRIRKHLSRQNWVMVAVDFLIVAVGVFLGLQAQQWYETRQDRLAEREYRERLADDFQEIAGSIDQCLRVFERSLDAVERVKSVLAAASSSGDVADATRAALPDALLEMTASVIPPGQSATFVEMLSSGDLAILSDETLRRSLIRYHEIADTNRENWRSLRNEVAEFGDTLYRHVTVDFDVTRDTYASIRDVDLEGLLADDEFRAFLTILAGEKANNHERCRYQKAMAQRVVDALAAASGADTNGN